MIQGLNGAPLALAVILFVVGMAPWSYRHMHRFTSFLIAGSAAVFAVAIPAWTGALAGLAATPTGLLTLSAVTLLSGWSFYREVWRNPAAMERRRRRTAKRAANGKGRSGGQGQRPAGALALAGGGSRPVSHHHRVRSNVVAAVFGTAAVITYGSLQHMATSAQVALTGTAKALTTSASQINSGQAAATVPPSHRMSILIAGVVILAVFALVLSRIEKRRHGGRSRGKTSQGGGSRLSPFAGDRMEMGGGR